MNGHGKSDRPVVPAKPPNKPAQAGAEAVEERGLPKGNTASETRPGRSAGLGVPSELDRVRQVARRDKDVRFTALFHHVTVDRLREAYRAIRPGAAPGVDGVTWRDYGQRSRSEPSRSARSGPEGRVPGETDSQSVHPKARWAAAAARVAALEDKILQRAVVEVLNAVYEEDFLGFSYGFRPGRSQHEALDALAVGITRKKVNFVLDADLRDFFTSLDQSWLLKFLEHRIADRRILRLIQKWLRAGVIEDGEWSKTEEGTAQGAAASPLLANVYLYVCPERRARRCRSCCDSCCAGDGGWPSGFAVQAGSPNRRGVMPVKSRGGKRLRKRPAVSGSGVRREDEHG